MAPRKRLGKNNIVARLVAKQQIPCAFCNRQVDDELLYGKVYALGNIQCHYYCALLSSCLIQKGNDDQGLYGFLYEDILAEVERCKKHKCSYCNQIGANLGCSISQCRKQFHLPCGKQKNSMSLFYGNYKTFCQNHAPKQKIPESIMMKARLRKSKDNKMKKLKDCNFKDLKELSQLSVNDNDNDTATDTQSVCVICYESVDGYPTPHTFWPPCCARDAWFHSTCLQRMALSAGMHYLKCPLCNDKNNFYEAVISQGYYVPDRDAAWELEQNAFAEIYERPIACSADDCQCPHGRAQDDDNGSWSISICMLCGSSGQHSACLERTDEQTNVHMYVCAVCKPAAPSDLENLANSIEAVISMEQAQQSSRRRPGPVMPSRMSLRRTKRRVTSYRPSSSSQNYLGKAIENDTTTATQNTASSRGILNLKPPRKQTIDNVSRPPMTLKFSPKKNANDKSPVKCSKYESPTKILEEGLRNKFGSKDVVVNEKLILEFRKRFRKPQPLRMKKKIVNDILNGFFDNMLQEPKLKTPIKQWCSPKKCSEVDDDVIVVSEKPTIIDLTEQQVNELSPTTHTLEIQPYIYNSPNKLKMFDIQKDSSLEISAEHETVNIDVFKVETDTESADIQPQPGSKSELLKALLLKPRQLVDNIKFSPYKKDLSDFDVKSFKNEYLNEVSNKVEEKSKKKSNRKRKIQDRIVFEMSSKKRKKEKRSISIKNKNIRLKIKWRDEEVKLKFDTPKKKNKKVTSTKFKQYVLQYSPEKPNIGKPEIDVTPIKRKYIKQEKSPDNLVQTSIQSFFRPKTSKE